MDLHLSARWEVNTLTHMHVLNSFCSMPNIHALAVQDARNKTPKRSVDRLWLRRLYPWPWTLHLFSTLVLHPVLKWPFVGLTLSFQNNLPQELSFLIRPKWLFCPKKEKGPPSSVTSEDYFCHSSIILWTIRSSQGSDSSFSLSSHQVHCSTTIW